MRTRIRIQVNKITKLISNHFLEVKKKNNLYLNQRLATFLGSNLENIISYEKTTKICQLNSAFPFILYLWIQMKCGSDRIQINITAKKTSHGSDITGSGSSATKSYSHLPGSRRHRFVGESFHLYNTRIIALIPCCVMNPPHSLEIRPEKY